MVYLPQHDSCFAHTIQLVAKDGFKNAKAINKVLAKAASIVSYVRKSVNASEILEGERRLQAKDATRWNSELKSILRVPVEKLQLLHCQQLNSYDCLILNDLIEILTLFEEATDATQGQNIVTGSFIIPCRRGLRASLNSLTLKYQSSMFADLLASLNQRMSCYEGRIHFICAAILDLRFKLEWCGSKEESLNMKSKFIEIFSNELYDVLRPISEMADPTEQPQPKRSRLFSYLSSSASTSSQRIDDPEESEVTLYLSEPVLPEDTNPLNFWKLNGSNFPKLSNLAKHYLSIPASSAPVERLFSIAGKIFRPDRCSMTDTVFQKLIAIKCNGHILN